jgi:methylated-DNA-[protein]-cysteine S-methyltransferase
MGSQPTRHRTVARESRPWKDDDMQYVIFKTRWGYFGLAGTDGTTGGSTVGRVLNPRDGSASTDRTTGGSGERELADGVVLRTCLPLPDRRRAEQEMLDALGPARDRARFDKTLFPDLQQRIAAYFEGDPVDFSTDPAISLDGLSPWDHKVLLTCRKIPSGRTTTYGELAVRIGHPGAARAVGSALARNPIPLIIPCHRVLRTDGALGGFSAPGGLTTKQALLRHEQATAIVPSNRCAAAKAQISQAKYIVPSPCRVFTVLHRPEQAGGWGPCQAPF